VTPGAFQTKNAGSPKNLCFGPLDGFVTKLSPDGSSLVFSTYLGGTGFDAPSNGPLVDSTDHVYVNGFTNSTDFPVTRDAFQPANAGGWDGFVSELTPDGRGLAFSSYLGGSSDDGVNGAVLDPSGNLYVTGCTSSTDFPTTPGAFQTQFNGGGDNPLGLIFCGGMDAFVTKIAFESGHR
jgi:Beta-propeller repeat